MVKRTQLCLQGSDRNGADGRQETLVRTVYYGNRTWGYLSESLWAKEVNLTKNKGESDEKEEGRSVQKKQVLNFE